MPRVSGISAVLLALALPARAGPFRDEGIEVELVAEDTAVRPGTTAWVGLRLAPDPHGHVYWRNPGDSGAPPTLVWDLPAGVRAGAIRWPAPERIATPPLVTFGYTGEVLLAVPVEVPAGYAEASLPLRAHAAWLVCDAKGCVRGEADLVLDLPVLPEGGEPDPRPAALFASARKLLPAEPPPGALSVLPAEDGMEILVALPRVKPVAFFPHGPGQVPYAAPQSVREERGLALLRLAVPDEGLPGSLRGVLVVDTESGRRAFAVGLPVAARVSTLQVYVTPGPPWILASAAGALLYFAGRRLLRKVR